LTPYWSISPKDRRRAYLAHITFALAFVVILLGAYTRLTNAGLSCPDWPNCYGYITAPHTSSQLQDAAQRYPSMPIDIKKAWTEMTHRYFAGTEGILILLLSFSMLFSMRPKQTKFIVASITLIALLGCQVLLGMLTVTEKLKPVIVLGHLLTGLSLLSLLWWTYLNLKNPLPSFSRKPRPRILSWMWLGFFILIAQITLGGWVSTHYAGLACIDFPYCNGQLLPTLQWGMLNTDLISIHMLHRIGAAITATYLLILAICMTRHTALKTTGMFIIIFIAAQLTLGILNIVWLRPVWIALMHHAVAILLLLTMIAALVRAYRDA
jgi:cytochrome c oxidase assembly protein subunit 15